MSKFDRRTFLGSTGAWLLMTACQPAKVSVDGAVIPAVPTPGAPVPAVQPAGTPEAPVIAPVNRVRGGTNLSGMEWAAPGLRYGLSSAPNLHYTVPRAADVQFLAASGFSKNRLPIQWELLQPVLSTTQASAASVAALGAPGAFHPAYESYITGVLDAHAAAGITCIIDLHNYCRYQDFIYQPDGSIVGLVVPADPFLRPYTSDNTQVQRKVFALAPGASLAVPSFTDFWSRAARKWKGHPGLGGYGLMNEPHDLPAAGSITAVNETPPYTAAEDQTIWPTFAQAAIDAIRAIDSSTPIYVSGNGWDSAMGIGNSNPGYPLRGSNLIYEVHMYLDASSAGAAFDYDTEVAKVYSAGLQGPIEVNTGMNRLMIATDWARAHAVKLALTEVGMPLDDPRWEAMFINAINHASAAGYEVFSWMGGCHWPSHSFPINHVPEFYQDRTLEPAVSGPMKAAFVVPLGSLFDESTSFSSGGAPVPVTVSSRGHLPAAIQLNVTSNNGGAFSKTTLTIPAGPNGQDTFTFTPAADSVTTLTYSGNGPPGGVLPPPRRIFSLSNPVASASSNLADAALAILARYGAAKWDLADAYTDYLQGVPAHAGDPVRAVADSGFASSVGNAMNMLNWVNKAQDGMGPMQVPMLRVTNGFKSSDHSAGNTWGLWCKKSVPVAGIQPRPRDRVLYNLEDPHFVMAVIAVPSASNNGVIFQASRSSELFTSELGVSNSIPTATWIDAGGQQVQLRSAVALTVSTPSVLSMTCAPGAQALRVNGAAAGTSAATLAPGLCDQMLMGWGFLSYYPRESFAGSIYAVIAGKGAPAADELAVLEKYLGSLAGVAI